MRFDKIKNDGLQEIKPTQYFQINIKKDHQMNNELEIIVVIGCFTIILFNETQ